MRTTSRWAAMAVSIIAVSLPALAGDEKPASERDAYVPRLNDMMVATQLRHFKLWYAGAVKNWPLANYELAQIRASIEQAQKLYPDNNHTSDMKTMTPPSNELERNQREGQRKISPPLETDRRV